MVKATGARHSLNMISAVTAKGLLRFSTYTGSFTGARFIEFCRKLMADTDGPVYLVVDGHPTHRSKLVKEFVASTDGQLRLFVLPAYSPQLNQPPVHRAPAQRRRDVLRVHPGLDRVHRPLPHRLQRPVVQLAAVVLAHTALSQKQKIKSLLTFVLV